MTEQTVATIKVEDLKKLMDKDPELCLIDVREQYEWDEAHIPGAIHIPKAELPNKISMTINDKDQPLYLHCKGGVRSAQSAQKLLEMGYKHVYSVEGGIMAWAEKGYLIV